MVSRLKIKLFDTSGSKGSAPVPPTPASVPTPPTPGVTVAAASPPSAQEPTQLAYVVAEPADNEAYWDGYDTQIGDPSDADLNAVGGARGGERLSLKRVGLVGAVSVLLVAGGFAGFIFYLGDDNPFRSELAPILDAIWGDTGDDQVAESPVDARPPVPKVKSITAVAATETVNGAKTMAEGKGKPAATRDIERIYTALPNPLPQSDIAEDAPVKEGEAEDKAEEPPQQTEIAEDKGATDGTAQADAKAADKADSETEAKADGKGKDGKGKDGSGKSPSEDFDPALAEAMDHEYVYQHYRAIQEIRESQIKKAAVLLRQGLVDRKFWNRMYAAIGLVEFGVMVTEQELTNACEEASSELVANFFRRFSKNPNAAQVYVMRHILRFADTRGRLVLLEGISRYKDELRPNYVVAATMDRSPKVKAWANAALKKLRLPKERLVKLREEIGRYAQ